MKTCYESLLQKITLSIFLGIFSGVLPLSVLAQQADRPFSVELNAGGGLIGNSTANTAFQPELGVNYMPGRWGIGLNAGLYSFGSGFSADQYRMGFEQYTIAEQSSDQWNAISINAGPRFQQSLSRLVQFNVGLDLAMNYQKAPSQSVRFFDPSGEMEGTDYDTDIVLAEMNDAADAGRWSAAVRPQIQLEFTPGFSNRFSFNMKTGIQHHLSDRDITYTERDLTRVRQMDNVYEMHHQFEQAPVVQRTESAPKTNFFANAGIKISFGGSSASTTRARGYFESDQQRTAAESPNDDGSDAIDEKDIVEKAQHSVPVEITHQGRLQGEAYQEDRDEIDINEDAIETAQDYNSVRSNTRRGEMSGGDDGDGNIDINDDAIETAQDYNSVRSNTRRGEMSGGDDGDLIGFHFELEIVPLDPDDDGDGVMGEPGKEVPKDKLPPEIKPEVGMGLVSTTPDGDGLLDAVESATYSISDKGKEIETMERTESAAQGMRPTGNVYKWTYNLSSVAANKEYPGSGTLTVLFTGGKWHFDVQLAPNDDGYGYGELLQNSSFSISKRSKIIRE